MIALSFLKEIFTHAEEVRLKRKDGKPFLTPATAILTTLLSLFLYLVDYARFVRVQV